MNSNLFNKFKDISNKKELGKYLVGGCSAVISDFLIYKLLIYLCMDISLAKLLSFAGGSVTGFVINKLWTFKSNGILSHEIGKYAILYTATAFTNIAINNVVLNLTGVIEIAFLAATGTSTVCNFLGQKFFVFRKVDI